MFYFLNNISKKGIFLENPFSENILNYFTEILKSDILYI